MKTKAIVCDIDGTLALFGDRPKFDRDYENDTLNEPVATLIKNNRLPFELIFVSGRKEQFREVTKRWLCDHLNLAESTLKLFMRRDGDFRKDWIVKQEIYNTVIKDSYDIVFVLDDRNQVVEMWRANGLACFQVAEGDF